MVCLNQCSNFIHQMGETKLITIKQYAALKKCSTQNIERKIHNGNISKDKNIVSVNKYGRFYLIEVVVG